MDKVGGTMNTNKQIKIVLAVLSVILLFAGCTKSVYDQPVGMNDDAAIYGPVIFYNGNFG